MVISANSTFPNTSYNNLPNPLTGNINIVSVNGALYFARDNGPLYQLNGSLNNITQIGTGNISAANDFGPKQM